MDSVGRGNYMKKADDVTLSLINDIKEMSGKQCFQNAFRISNDLTNFSSLIDNDDAILIGEVFEGIFSQIGHIFDNYKMTDEEINSFINEFNMEISSLVENYQKKDYEKLYLNLRYLRSKATKLQLKQIKMGTEKEDRERFSSFNKFMSQIME